MVGEMTGRLVRAVARGLLSIASKATTMPPKHQRAGTNQSMPQARRDELWQALEYLHSGKFATPIGARQQSRGACPAGSARHREAPQGRREASACDDNRSAHPMNCILQSKMSS
jgi:hypothetical protein